MEKMRKKVLFMTPAVHAAISSGGQHVTLERLSALAVAADVTVLTLSADGEARRLFPEVDWVVAGSLRPRSVLNLLYSYFADLPLSVWRNTTAAIAGEARKLNARCFDLVYIDHWLMGEAGRVCTAKYKVLHLHNAEPEIFRRAAVHATLSSGLVLRLEARRCATYLRKLVQIVDELHLLSDDDRRCLVMRDIRHDHTHAFLPAVQWAQPAFASFAERARATLYIGTLSWHANQEGLHWYGRAVLPLLPTDIDLHLIGGGASRSLKDKLVSHANVKMHGYLDQIEHYYSTTRCLVAPLLSGSGIKMKIVHALARGLPVVTTPTGVEGFPAGFERAIFVGKDPKQFAEHVKSLLENESVWIEASHAAREYCSRHFSGVEWENWVRHLLPRTS